MQIGCSRRQHVLVLSYLYVAILCTCVLGIRASAAATAPVENRIARIVNGILPPVLIAGRPTPTAKLTERMAAHQVPGVSIAVINDGRVEWARGFGLTTIGSAPVTPETLFQAASISKPVVAAAVLRLVQQRTLALDADVNIYLRSWKVPANQFTAQKRVTPRGILTHTAGFNVSGFTGYVQNAPIPTLLQILNGENPANSAPIRVNAVPGAAYAYSGGGYVVMQQLLTDVTRTPFPRLMAETVLTPFGMTRSTYERPARGSDVALGHRYGNEPIEGGGYVYPELAPAGLWSTPTDLARVMIEIQRALKGRSRLLSEASAGEMLTRAPQGSAGLGPGVAGRPERPYFFSGGANGGFRGYMIAYNEGDGAVILTNSNSGNELRLEILRTIAHEYGWPDFQPETKPALRLDPSKNDRYLGFFLIGKSVCIISKDGDRLYAQLPGELRLPIYQDAEDRFFFQSISARLMFEGAGAIAERLVLRRDGNDQVGTRLPDSEGKALADAEQRRLQEQSPLPGTEASLRRVMNELRAGMPNYGEMTSEVAAEVRNVISGYEDLFSHLGALTRIRFRRAAPDGSDIYQTLFQWGATEWSIRLTTDGKIDGLAVQPD